MVMNTQLRQFAAFFRLRGKVLCISLAWLLGVFGGVWAVSFSKDISLVVKAAAALRPGFGALYAINAFPVLLLWAVLAVRWNVLACTWMFLYGLLRGFCGMCTMLAFGSGGWLARWLLLFSGSAVSLLMWRLIIASVSCGCWNGKRVCGFLMIITILTLFDCFVISPFLAGVV